MTTLIEKSILNERLEKSRSGIYADTSENRRKHRVGQKYGSEKKEEEKPEKTSSNEKDPAKELEAVDKVIAAINEGKLKLPQEEIMVLIENTIIFILVLIVDSMKFRRQCFVLS